MENQISSLSILASFMLCSPWQLWSTWGQRKETKETLGGGGKGVAAPKSGLDDALDQIPFLSWRDFRKSMEMGATVLGARYYVTHTTEYRALSTVAPISIDFLKSLQDKNDIWSNASSSLDFGAATPFPPPPRVSFVSFLWPHVLQSCHGLQSMNEDREGINSGTRCATIIFGSNLWRAANSGKEHNKNRVMPAHLIIVVSRFSSVQEYSSK